MGSYDKKFIKKSGQKRKEKKVIEFVVNTPMLAN
jgi:hypothetical protein